MPINLCILSSVGRPGLQIIQMYIVTKLGNPKWTALFYIKTTCVCIYHITEHVTSTAQYIMDYSAFTRALFLSQKLKIKIHVTESALFALLSEDYYWEKTGCSECNDNSNFNETSSLMQPSQRGFEALGKLQWIWCRDLEFQFWVSGVINVLLHLWHKLWAIKALE